jgi:hypothetical protein
MIVNLLLVCKKKGGDGAFASLQPILFSRVNGKFRVNKNRPLFIQSVHWTKTGVTKPPIEAVHIVGEIMETPNCNQPFNIIGADACSAAHT